MKVLLFSGSHPRHLYLHQKIVENFEICGAVVYKREEILPSPPEDIPEQDKKNFIRHFNDRLEAEKKYFGEREYQNVYKDIPNIVCQNPSELNSEKTAEFIKEQSPDICIIFGTLLIKDPVYSVLPSDKLNIHLGLSPWYKGSATLFWPFYELKPHHAGVTIHQIVDKPDAGAIIHQCVPKLEKNDGIHDVGCKAVIKASEDLKKILEYRRNNSFQETIQKTQGRLYLSRDFKPEHLRVIYDLYDNKIVNKFLAGDLQSPPPKLIEMNF